jgi:hypothetical protein
MATINFRLRGKASSGNVLIRLKHGDQFDFERSTGLQVELNHWSHSKQKVKNIATTTYKDDVNNKLNGLKTFIEAEYYKALSHSEKISQEWLKKNVDDFFGHSDTSRKDDYANKRIRDKKNSVLPFQKLHLSIYLKHLNYYKP